MPEQTKPTPTLTSDTQTTELQMRRALGLNGPGRPVTQQRPEQARARHRFVQDGGVPVVVVNRSDDATAPFKARIGELEAALDQERATHANTRKALHDAQLAAQALQTRLAHAELASRDVIEAERQARQSVEAARREAEARAAELEAKQARRKQPAPAQPEPVKWWLPNYNSKK